MKNLSSFQPNKCGFNAHIPSDTYVISQIFACVVYGVLFISTLLLNSISIFVIWKSSQLNEKVSYFTILIQSTIDLITGVITLPIHTAHVLLKDVIHVENEVICWIHLTFGFLPFAISALTLCVLSFERYMGVLHPFVHRTKVTKKRIITSQCCGGLLVFVCFYFPVDSQIFDMIVYLLLLVFFVFLLFVYTSIFVKARNSLRSGNRPGEVAAQPEHVSETKGKRLLLRELKLAKCCFLVVCTFGLCYLPFVIFLLPITNLLDDMSVEMLWSWTVAAAALNSSLNSIIFFWSKAMLRKEASKVLKRCCS